MAIMNRPNVLLICVEHWSGRLMSALGHPVVMTPTLDSLASNGVLFTNAYSTTPVCIPARRELMTGTFSRTHGARSFDQTITMDGRPTLPQTFRDAGYQAYAVGKLHVQPQRARIGFDDVMLDEAAKERRHNPDDYEMFLTAEGYHGQQLTHASGNDYFTRTWHLPEHTHPANWTAREMCRYIVRRDPSRPAFWYMSFVPPHPPLTPPEAYMELYRNVDVGEPFVGEWAEDAAIDALCLQGEAARRRPPLVPGADAARREARLLRPVHPRRPPDQAGHRHAARGGAARRYGDHAHRRPRRHDGQPPPLRQGRLLRGLGQGADAAGPARRRLHASTWAGWTDGSRRWRT